MEIFLEQFSLILTYAGIAQGFFFALLLNNKSVRRSRANLFLSILLLALSFSILHMMYSGMVLEHFSIQSYPLGDPTFFLIAPLLWFYVKELTGDKVNWSFLIIFHFLPFIIIILFSLILKIFPADSAIIIYLDDHRKLSAILFWIFIIEQFFCYLYFIHKRWRSYQKLIEQEVSNTENVNISWVRFFMGVFLFINFFYLFTLFTLIHIGNIFWSYKTISTIFSLSIFALGYKGLLQKEIFYTNSEESKLNTFSSPEVIVKKVDQELIAKLLIYMEEKKPYLDPELTLSSMAKDLSLSRSLLSQLINEGIGDNFYNFINKYRVEQVKKFMIDPTMKNYNMLGIALEAGFKSKSTFNLIFKRFTGLTPTEYIKNLSK